MEHIQRPCESEASSNEEDLGSLGIFPGIANEFPLALLPDPVRLMIGDLVDSFEAPPVAAAAVASSLCAAAAGPCYRLQLKNHASLTAGFHILVAHNDLRQLPWFDVLQAPLVGRVASMQHDLHADGREGTWHLIQQYERISMPPENVPSIRTSR